MDRARYYGNRRFTSIRYNFEFVRYMVEDADRLIANLRASSYFLAHFYAILVFCFSSLDLPPSAAGERGRTRAQP